MVDGHKALGGGITEHSASGQGVRTTQPIRVVLDGTAQLHANVSGLEVGCSVAKLNNGITERGQYNGGQRKCASAYL